MGRGVELRGPLRVPLSLHLHGSASPEALPTASFRVFSAGFITET